MPSQAIFVPSSHYDLPAGYRAMAVGLLGDESLVILERPRY